MINSSSAPPVSATHTQPTARRLRLVDTLTETTVEDGSLTIEIERRPSPLVGILVLVIAAGFAIFTPVSAASWICLGIVGVLFLAHGSETTPEAASNTDHH